MVWRGAQSPSQAEKLVRKTLQCTAEEIKWLDIMAMEKEMDLRHIFANRINRFCDGLHMVNYVKKSALSDR